MAYYSFIRLNLQQERDSGGQKLDVEQDVLSSWRDSPCTMFAAVFHSILEDMQGYLHAMNLGMCLFLNVALDLHFGWDNRLKHVIYSSWVQPWDRKIPRVLSSWTLNERVLLRLGAMNEGRQSKIIQMICYPHVATCIFQSTVDGSEILHQLIW